jgi:hypothetical protein
MLSTVATKTASAARIATPWGRAALVEEISLPQRVGDKRFSSLVQLLETQKGERLVRFAYATTGSVRRGPVTLRGRDVDQLRKVLRQRPGLADALDLRLEG